MPSHIIFTSSGAITRSRARIIAEQEARAQNAILSPDSPSLLDIETTSNNDIDEALFPLSDQNSFSTISELNVDFFDEEIIDPNVNTGDSIQNNTGVTDFNFRINATASNNVDNRQIIDANFLRDNILNYQSTDNITSLSMRCIKRTFNNWDMFFPFASIERCFNPPLYCASDKKYYNLKVSPLTYTFFVHQPKSLQMLAGKAVGNKMQSLESCMKIKHHNFQAWKYVIVHISDSILMSFFEHFCFTFLDLRNILLYNPPTDNKPIINENIPLFLSLVKRIAVPSPAYVENNYLFSEIFKNYIHLIEKNTLIELYDIGFSYMAIYTFSDLAITSAEYFFYLNMHFLPNVFFKPPIVCNAEFQFESTYIVSIMYKFAINNLPVLEDPPYIIPETTEHLMDQIFIEIVWAKKAYEWDNIPIALTYCFAILNHYQSDLDQTRVYVQTLVLILKISGDICVNIPTLEMIVNTLGQFIVYPEQQHMILDTIMYVNINYGFFHFNHSLFKKYKNVTSSISIFHSKTLFAYTIGILAEIENVILYFLWFNIPEVKHTSLFSNNNLIIKVVSLINTLRDLLNDFMSSFHLAEYHYCMALYTLYVYILVQFYDIEHISYGLPELSITEITIKSHFMQCEHLLSKYNSKLGIEVSTFLLYMNNPTVNISTLDTLFDSFTQCNISPIRTNTYLRIFFFNCFCVSSSIYLNSNYLFLKHAYENLKHITDGSSYRLSLMHHVVYFFATKNVCPINDRYTIQCHQHIHISGNQEIWNQYKANIWIGAENLIWSNRNYRLSKRSLNNTRLLKSSDLYKSSENILRTLLYGIQVVKYFVYTFSIIDN